MNQRDFWAGNFGSEYIERNASQEFLASNLALFAKVCSNLPQAPKNILELGANIGMNAKALRLLFPRATFSGVEINSEACNQLRSIADIVFESSIEDFNADSIYDFVFTKGVLIHLAPESLNDAYNKLYNCSSRWILIAEYYNPSPVALEYRGFKDKLFKRDFAGELMKLHRDLELRASGFSYHSGPFPQDDISWFLFEKANQ